MRGVDLAFQRLQPVAVEERAHEQPVFLAIIEELVVGQERRLVRAQIREDHAAALDARVGEMTHFVFVRALRRLGRHLEHAARDVEEPAVVEAAQAAVFDSAVAEIGAAMRAQKAEQSRPAGIVAEENEILAEDSHRLGRAAGRQLRRERDRMPVLAHERAARRTGSGLRDEIVLFFGQHVTPPLRRARAILRCAGTCAAGCRARWRVCLRW